MYAIPQQLPPWINNPNGTWLTVSEFAKEWRKNRHTIRKWCENGFIYSLGFSTYRDASGQWFIRIS